MTTQALLGAVAIGLSTIALVLIIADRSKSRRPAAFLIPFAVILGMLHTVVRLPSAVEWLSGIVSLLLGVLALRDFYKSRGRDVAGR